MERKPAVDIMEAVCKHCGNNRKIIVTLVREPLCFPPSLRSGSFSGSLLLLLLHSNRSRLINTQVQC